MTENYNCSAVSSLEDISCKWNTDDVVALLEKNGLIECCAAIIKRRVDGKALLSLTEQNFKSWKNDLPISSFWSLHRFAVELKKNPENYLPSRETGSISSSMLNSDAFSDSDPWDTDFEDDEDISTTNPNHYQRLAKPGENNYSNKKREEEEEGEEEEEKEKEKEKEEEKEEKEEEKEEKAEEEDKEKKKAEMQYWQNKSRSNESRAPPSISGMKKPAAYLKRRQQEEEEEEEEVETEEDEKDEGENFYQNGIELNDGSNLMSLLQEELRLRGRKNKPAICPKPQLSEAKANLKPSTNGNKSFSNSHILAKIRTTNNQQTKNQESRYSSVSAIKSELFKNKPYKKPEENPPAPPKPRVTQSFVPSIRNLPKPPSTPITIEKLDLLADLPKPNKNADSFITRVNSVLRTSIESVYRPHSVSSVEGEEAGEEDEDTTYETVKEMPVHFKSSSDEDYLQPIRPSVLKFRQPQPITLPIISTVKERSPDKKIGIYPASGNQARVPRPLPPPPDSQKAERPADISARKKDGQSYKEKPWFHNVSRDEAGALITAGVTEFGSSQHNGYFLLRPSGNFVDQPFTLVLWFKNRPFNIPVRKRPDSRFALGTEKPDEQSFASVEEIVDFYKQTELVLHRSRVLVGSTRLTDTPPKRND